VKIRLTDGTTRRLEFVGLTGTHLLAREPARHGLVGPVERIPLTQVRSVKKTNYKATLVMGVAVGVFSGWLAYCSWACAGEGTRADAVSAGLLFGGLGAAGGAALGYAIDRRPSRGTTIYLPTTKASAAIAPVIAPHRLGAVVSVRW
jgi:hypothetical protein